MDNYKDIEEAEQHDIERKESYGKPIHVSKLASWIDDAAEAALRACDDAAMIPGFQMQSTRDLLEAGYRLYHSTEYVPDADGPESDE